MSSVKGKSPIATMIDELYKTARDKSNPKEQAEAQMKLEELWSKWAEKLGPAKPILISTPHGQSVPQSLLGGFKKKERKPFVFR